MSRRTLATTWSSFERLVRLHAKSLAKTGDGKAAKGGGKTEAIDELIRKSNASRIGEALATLFVHPYGMTEATVQFAESTKGKFPDWNTTYDENKGVIWVNVLGVFRFLDECAAAVETLKTPEARKSFQDYRYQAYLAQLGKLPSRNVLFLLILRQVAAAQHITDVEKKGGEIEVAKGEVYLQLLWAFKELESFFRRTSGVDLRAEFGILWLESDWYVGK